ncbi:MAG: hypothetical protein JJU29_18920 [Verrucomicrobia bacterium]|nr:hypothetical protein [Verrucomicrobiota bacterium]MCH8514129.1 hypothetical protein [Kiritimatiellia bacterium]
MKLILFATFYFALSVWAETYQVNSNPFLTGTFKHEVGNSLKAIPLVVTHSGAHKSVEFLYEGGFRIPLTVVDSESTRRLEPPDEGRFRIPYTEGETFILGTHFILEDGYKYYHGYIDTAALEEDVLEIGSVTRKPVELDLSGISELIADKIRPALFIRQKGVAALSQSINIPEGMNELQLMLVPDDYEIHLIFLDADPEAEREEGDMPVIFGLVGTVTSEDIGKKIHLEMKEPPKPQNMSLIWEKLHKNWPGKRFQSK